MEGERCKEGYDDRQRKRERIEGGRKRERIR